LGALWFRAKCHVPGALSKAKEDGAATHRPGFIRGNAYRNMGRFV
jgi:hypothetical protein